MGSQGEARAGQGKLVRPVMAVARPDGEAIAGCLRPPRAGVAGGSGPPLQAVLRCRGFSSGSTRLAPMPGRRR